MTFISAVAIQYVIAAAGARPGLVWQHNRDTNPAAVPVTEPVPLVPHGSCSNEPKGWGKGWCVEAPHTPSNRPHTQRQMVFMPQRHPPAQKPYRIEIACVFSLLLVPVACKKSFPWPYRGDRRSVLLDLFSKAAFKSVHCSGSRQRLGQQPGRAGALAADCEWDGLEQHPNEQG